MVGQVGIDSLPILNHLHRLHGNLCLLSCLLHVFGNDGVRIIHEFSKELVLVLLLRRNLRRRFLGGLGWLGLFGRPLKVGGALIGAGQRSLGFFVGLLHLFYALILSGVELRGLRCDWRTFGGLRGLRRF